MRALMLQGTGSNVGKSVLLAGLARAFTLRGLKIRPFKAQNMSNNAAICANGGEIGRAQALQALAAKCVPHTDMNPVLLKPETDTGAQLILQGKRIAQVKAEAYGAMKGELLPAVLESYARLSAQSDLVLVEGAGSPAEVNLRAGDIANMGFAKAAQLPVILVGDIDRGGVIAQLVGTKAVLSPRDNRHIKGFLVNKFRGDRALFQEGYEVIKARTGWRGLGVCPWFEDAARLPAEDALDIAHKTSQSRGNGGAKIGCLQFQRIANFDDLDPLTNDPDISLTMIKAGEPIPGDLELVILPGSKSTVADLAFLRAQGWDIDLSAHMRRGGHVLGLCAGYQMLGQTINDPEAIEGAQGCVKGLGFLDIKTELTPKKRLCSVEAVHVETGEKLSGYEMHIGRSDGGDCVRPFARIDGVNEGAISADGLVTGTYMHGIFASDGFRRSYLKNFGISAGKRHYMMMVEKTLDQLGAHLEHYCDLDAMLELAELKIS